MRPIKVLIACSAYPPYIKGGGELSTQALARGLIRQGLDVTVVTMGERDGEELDDGLKLYRLRPRNLYWSAQAKGKSSAQKLLFHAIDSCNPVMGMALRRVLERERPAIYHSSTTEDLSPYAWRVAGNLGIPVVHTLRSYSLMCPAATMFKGGKNCMEQCWNCRVFTSPRRYLSGYVDSVIGISRAVLQTHLDAGYFSRAKTAVIRNIYEKPEDASFAVSPPPGRLRLGFIGRIEYIKGLHTLLHALRDSGFGTAVELKVAGAGADADAVAQMVEAQRQGVAIKLMGWVKPEEFYPTIDVLVVPSLWREPLGRIVFEAYAYGVPVLGARRGGIPEIIDEGETGFVFDPEQPQELRQLLLRLLGQPSALEGMRLKCRRKAAEFSSETIGAQHVALYSELLSTPRRVEPPGKRTESGTQ